MDIIQGIIPSNPIDAEKRDRIVEIVKEVVTVFSKQYLQATKDVVLDEAEYQVSRMERKRAKWERKHEKRERLLAAHGLPPSGEVWDPKLVDQKPTKDDVLNLCLSDLKSGLHCSKPRYSGVEKERRPRERRIKFEIIGYVILDEDFDAYCSYLILSQLGSQVSLRFRRYNQFKVFHKVIAKKFKLETPFAPAPTFGGRDLSPEFILHRKELLSAWLHELCENPEAVNCDSVLAFFGQAPITDMAVHRIEERTIQGTLHQLNLGFVRYEDLSDALTKIIIIKLRREMWQSIVDACPPNEKPRKAALKIANKTLDAVVGPAVETGVREAKEACAPIQKKLTDMLVSVASVAVKAKHDVVNGLTDAMSTALSPIVGALSQMISQITRVLAPPLMGVLAGPITTLTETMDKLIQYFAVNDEGSVVELGNAFGRAIDGIGDRIREALKEAVANLVGDRGKLVTNACLDGIMILIELFVDLFAAIVMAIFNPVPWFSTLVYMIHYKEKVLKANPGDIEGVMRVCDDQEDDMDFVIECNSGDFMAGAQKILDGLSQLGDNAGQFFGVLSDMFDDFRIVTHDKFFKRFYRKFGDYIWGSLNLPTDTRKWDEKVTHSFTLAFRSSIKHALKGISNILKNRLCDLMAAPIMHSINENVTPQIKSSIEPISNAIPGPVKDFLDVEGMVDQVIEGCVHDSCMRIIEDQTSIVGEAFATKVGFPWSTPFMPTFPPFPYGYPVEAPSAPSLEDTGAVASADPTVTTTVAPSAPPME